VLKCARVRWDMSIELSYTVYLNESIKACETSRSRTEQRVYEREVKLKPV